MTYCALSGTWALCVVKCKWTPSLSTEPPGTKIQHNLDVEGILIKLKETTLLFSDIQQHN